MTKTGYSQNLYWVQKSPLNSKYVGHTNPQITAMKDWCLDRFGVDHNRNWYYRDFTFYFQEKAHFTLFLLRWP